MKLKEYLEKYGVRQTFLCERLSISPQCLTRYLSGYNRPSLEVMAKMEDVTDGKVSIRDWLKVEDSKDDATQNAKTT